MSAQPQRIEDVADFCGNQLDEFGAVAFELWVLKVPIKRPDGTTKHPANSSVARNTIEQHFNL